MIFLLGTHHPQWLWNPAAGFPLFVSHRRLSGYKTLRPATHRWALDSGGFTEVSTYGEWRTGPREYVHAVARYSAEIGNLDWAAPQDWMCEPWIMAKTGLSVAEHQARTVANFLDLRELWRECSDEECPFIPVLQGWSLPAYEACAERYEIAGVSLEKYPAVGLGSVCRRQATAEIGAIVSTFASLALHGFGVKIKGLAAYGHLLASADSMAWSYSARRRPPLPGHTHKNCANCLPYAAAWRARVLDSIREAA